MPSYAMICDECMFQDTIMQSIHKTLPTKCPVCKKKKFRQNYEVKRVNVNDGVIRTLGQQAEKNRKEMGEEQFQMKSGKKKKKPWFRDTDKPLDVSKISNVEKYIHEGTND